MVPPCLAAPFVIPWSVFMVALKVPRMTSFLSFQRILVTLPKSPDNIFSSWNVKIHSKIDQGGFDIRIQISLVIDGSGVVSTIVHNDFVRRGNGNGCIEQVVDRKAGKDEVVFPPRCKPGWGFLVNEYRSDLQIQLAPFQRVGIAE